MTEKIYLNLLILCGILSQGIVGTFLGDNQDNSSDLHSRKKRANNLALVERRELSTEDVTWIVEVLHNGVRICTGIVVSPEHVLTLKECVKNPATEYSVKAGHLFVHTIQIHPVVDKSVVGNIALLSVKPWISIQTPSPNRYIKLFEGPVEPHTPTTVSSFATNSEGNEPLTFRRATNVAILRLKLCQNYYVHRVLTNDHICALESAGETGFTAKDRGSALVLDGKLVGVLVYPGNLISYTSPDVFIRVNDNNIYNRWIKSHIEQHVPTEVIVQQPHPHTSPNHFPHSYASPNRSPNQYTSHNHSPHPYTSKNYYPHPHTSQSYSPRPAGSPSQSPQSQYSQGSSDSSTSSVA